MKDIDLPKLYSEIRAFVEERDWDQFHSVKNLACALSVESSELLELFQWLKEEESNHVKDDSKVFPKLEDEVADVFIYLLRLSDKAGIDLETAVRQKMKKNAAKYPVDKARGRATKYTDL